MATFTVASARYFQQNKIKVRPSVTHKRGDMVPERLHFHLLPFHAGKPLLYSHLHGQKEQVVNVFSRLWREGLIVEGKKENVPFPVSNGK